MRPAPSRVSGDVHADLVGGPWHGRRVRVPFVIGGVIMDGDPTSSGRYIWGTGSCRGKLLWKDPVYVSPSVPVVVMNEPVTPPPPPAPPRWFVPASIIILVLLLYAVLSLVYLAVRAVT